MHPLLSSPQVSSCPFTAQTLPDCVHSAGAAGHVPQVAAPTVPVQGADVQAIWPVTVRHLLASTAQEMTFLLVASQNVPACPLVQAAGLVGQVQTALGKLPPQGSLVGQVVLAAG